MKGNNSKGSNRAQGMLRRAANKLGLHARVDNPLYKSPVTGRPPRKASRREGKAH